LAQASSKRKQASQPGDAPIPARKPPSLLLAAAAQELGDTDPGRLHHALELAGLRPSPALDAVAQICQGESPDRERRSLEGMGSLSPSQASAGAEDWRQLLEPGGEELQQLLAQLPVAENLSVEMR